MDYRREIDGLRAVAVLPVILFHAGFEVFSGGFVGVDIFFVISGYLITTIILAELEQERFSIVSFYERRARRILPALFSMMFVCLLVGYFTLMPDEFKNLGQSLVATSLFSNNVLLALTSGYWSLASEFKPLLHTWSLGVEEQYYVIVPMLLLLSWRYCKNKITLILGSIFVGSLIFAIWFTSASPQWSFYILPTRAWEIAIGGLSALILLSNPKFSARTSNLLSLTGLALIVSSIFGFDKAIPSPSYYLLIPTIGATLVIIFAKKDTYTHFFLAHRFVVFFGLLSYSLYLWHQPVFAYLRIYSVEKPSTYIFAVSIFAVFAISYLSWKYIETPFRHKQRIKQKSVFAFAFLGSIFFVATGVFLNNNYGMPSRVFDSSFTIGDMDKRIYNERVFSYKADSFVSTSGKKLLIIGNSFGRDFTNITLETYNTSNIEIIYRDDLAQCIFPYKNIISEQLFSKADIIVFASNEKFSGTCLAGDIDFASNNGKNIFYVGSKDFGFNLNWIARLPFGERQNKYNVISDDFIEANIEMSRIVPPEHYISLLTPTLVSNKVPITDDVGRMISMDRAHLTKYGAIYFGQNAVKRTNYSDFFVQ